MTLSLEVFVTFNRANQVDDGTRTTRKARHMAKRKKKDDGFTNRPRADQMPLKYLVRRCPPRGFKGAIILSHNVIGRDLHYHGRQSRVCSGDGCEYCSPKQVPRWYGYVFATNTDLAKVDILEFTAGSMRPVDEYFRDHRTLIGAKVDMWRKGDEATGQVYCSLRLSKLNKEAFPKTPNLKKILCRMWGIEFDGIDVENPDLKMRTLEELERREREAS